MAKQGKNTTLKAAQQAADQAKRTAKYLQKQTQKEYKEYVREMRPFLKRLKNVDLRKDLSGAQKAAIRKAWKDYSALVVRPTKVYRTRNKKNREIVQEFAGHQKGKTKFDVAFLPTADQKAKIVFKGKEKKPFLKTKYATIGRVYFDKQNLAVNTDAEIARVLDQAKGARQFIVINGEYTMYNAGMDRGSVTPFIHRLMARYSPGGDPYEKRGPNSHFSNWLDGLQTIEAGSRENVRDYRQEYSRAARDAKDTKRKARRKRKAKYNTRISG